MKKIILLLLFLLTGCNSNNHDNTVSLTIDDGYYRLMRSCVYKNKLLVNCSYDIDNYFIIISENVIKFYRPYGSEYGFEQFKYTIDNDSIKFDKKNSNGVAEMKYTIDKNILNDNIIFSQFLQLSNDEFGVINRVYEKIDEKQYYDFRKLGATYEK